MSCLPNSWRRNGGRVMDSDTVAVIKEVYEHLGAGGVTQALRARGLPSRSEAFIRVWANRNGLKVTPEANRRIRSKPYKRGRDYVDHEIVAAVEAAKRGILFGERHVCEI